MPYCRQRIEKGNGLSDLLSCTIFNWDTCIYDVEDNNLLLMPEYLGCLANSTLDVNLEDNPNPTGSLVRALRRGALNQTRFGPRLTDFVRRHLHEEAWPRLMEVDTSAFRFPVLKKHLYRDICYRLEQVKYFGGIEVTEPFGAPREQLRLPI
jgi:hypothetical protein